MIRTLPPTRRPAFTLIELLVVISIIAILISLLAAAVMKVLGTGPKVQTQTEISKLHESLQVAAQGYNGLDYFPSKLVLYNDMQKYQTDTSTDAQRTADVLRKMFGPRLLMKTGNTYNKVDWAGRSPRPGTFANDTFTLEGQQCLVFYLGGIPEITGTAPNRQFQCLGFSSNPNEPTELPSASTTKFGRLGPYHQFPSSRLSTDFSSNNATNRFFCFLDPFGVPYAFFGTTGANNSYIDYCPNAKDLPPTGTGQAPHPYYQGSGANTKYFNPSTWQIISAGPDKIWAVNTSGYQWDPTQGATDKYTKDNMTNFAKRQLMARDN
jgi:prepilin-type N-terminal cleavage/methylation domain-containing protein